MFDWSHVYIGILVRQGASNKRAPQFLWHFSVSCFLLSVHMWIANMLTRGLSISCFVQRIIIHAMEGEGVAPAVKGAKEMHAGVTFKKTNMFQPCFFLRSEIGQLSPHFGAISWLDSTEALEKRKNKSTGENSGLNQWRKCPEKWQISVPCRGRTRPGLGAPESSEFWWLTSTAWEAAGFFMSEKESLMSVIFLPAIVG